jgi:hypothetical protein
MNTIDIKGTVSTPAISYNAENKLLIKGRSIPANEAKFYQPIIEWAGKVDIDKLIVDINLEYINSGSTKMLLSLLKTLDINTSIKKLVIKWYYEEGDEEAYESGKVFKELLRKAEFRFCRFRDAS